MEKLLINSPARLHLGFLNLNNESERNFGSLGLAVNNFKTIIEAEPSKKFQITGNDKKKVKQIIDVFKKKYDFLPCRINIIESIPEHIGLGSGTQLALSVGTLLSKLSNLKIKVNDLARTSNRGNRSSIGINCFKSGGFIVDAGKKVGSNKLSPVIFKHNWPKDWGIILLTDKKKLGIHGKTEKKEFKEIFKEKKKIQYENYEALITKIIPSIIENDFDSFTSGINLIQKNTGKSFYSAQGGQYTSKNVENIFNKLEKFGIQGYGQTSWGPTGFIFCKDKIEKKKIIEYLMIEIKKNNFSFIDIFDVKGRNHGHYLRKANCLV